MYALTPNAYWVMMIFIIGYAFITLEHFTKINKATVALIMAVLGWALLFMFPICPDIPDNLACFTGHLSNISQIVFFLLGALAIVEVINIHQGFKFISDYIHVGSKVKLLWILGISTFFLSSILDNLTTTIVMVSLLRKLIPEDEDRLILGGGIVIAANAGGAWTPIGDVTTTMLWIGGELSTIATMRDLFLPSVVCLVVSLFVLSWSLKGHFAANSSNKKEKIEPLGKTVLLLGIGSLVFVPIFKMLTGMPPFMGVIFGLGVIWVVTDWFHSKDGREDLKVPRALSRVDLSSTLFFLGILLAVDTLDAANLLDQLALWLDNHIGNSAVIATLIGLASAVVDNVPLVAAGMGMYDLLQYPQDSEFWQLVAYCAGTGGSILVIGSAAGVVFMGLEKVDFFWYLKRISFAALVGYFAGIGVYLIL